MLETSHSSSIAYSRIIIQLTLELGVQAGQLSAAIELLDNGATVPFIARYRKEATQGLNDTVLRQLESRLAYLRELEERRTTILASITQQGKLSAELQNEIENADSKQRLEDLYIPYKPKRRTRAQAAREAGLEPLVEAIISDLRCEPIVLAEQYLNPAFNIDTPRLVLEGARDILAERFAENADLLIDMRTYLREKAILYSKLIENKNLDSANFQDWFDFNESLCTLPSHRILALLRGRQLGVLELRIGLNSEQEEQTPHPCIARIADFLKLGKGLFALDASPAQRWLSEVCRWCWRVKLLPSLELEIFNTLRDQAHAKAIGVFAANLKDLLLAAPAGPKPILGLDPGIRTGVKAAAIDSTGKLIETTTVYPFVPRCDVEGTLKSLALMIQQHHIKLVAIGNGTGSRDTEKLIRELAKRYPELNVIPIVVSEAGASVYSASQTGAEEFPDLDVSLRGAVSIARRLQDPLAELVKIEPKAIGVGQYQHDVNQNELARSLEVVVEDCVNAVGVEVNTASAALLARVSGLNRSLAKNIVAWRDKNGAFSSRQTLRNVPRFGEKAFEQAAGFLRILNGENPLDASTVHPEAYPVVERILAKLNMPLKQIIGQHDQLKRLSPADFIDERFGLPTLRDIFIELEKPGRDPRPEWKSAQFKEGIETINDLQPGMVLEGVISNVASFGAFVDIGVHQDGLVHISALADHFVKDPRDIVQVGKTVRVKVLEVEAARKRIALTMRLNDTLSNPSNPVSSFEPGSSLKNKTRLARESTELKGAMANAFAELFAQTKR